MRDRWRDWEMAIRLGLVTSFLATCARGVGEVTPEAAQRDLAENYPGIAMAVGPLVGSSLEIPGSNLGLGVALHEVNGRANPDLVACDQGCTLFDFDSVRQEAVWGDGGWAQEWQLPALGPDAETIDPTEELVVVFKGDRYGVTLPFEVDKVYVERNGERIAEATPNAQVGLGLGEALVKLGTGLGVIPGVVEAAGPTSAAMAGAAASETLVPMPTSIRPEVAGGEYTEAQWGVIEREETAKQEKLLQELWNYWAHANSPAVFPNSEGSLNFVYKFDDPDSPTEACVAAVAAGYQGVDLLAVPYVNGRPSLVEPRQYVNGEVKAGQGPLFLTLSGIGESGRTWELGCHKGLWVRRDRATRVITEAIDERGKWTKTLAPELSVVGGLVTLGIMKDLVERETQPWVRVEPNPNTGTDWQERLEEYWWRLSYQNHIQNYPEDANVPWNEGWERLKSGEWKIKVWAADATKSTVRDRGRDELRVIEYSPLNGVVISAGHEVKELTAFPIRAAYSTVDENGRLVIEYNMEVVDFSKFYAMTTSDEISLGYTYMTTGIVWLTQVVTQPLATIERNGGYYGVFSSYPPSEIREWQSLMLTYGVDESNLDNSQPMVLVYTK